MALPNLWSLYNLRSSPYFQATLRADSQAMPLHLFVGRQRERQLLLTTIGSSASSLQPVNETVLLIDPARPATGEVFTQKFRLADARKEITQSRLDQLVDPPQLLAVVALPMEVVIPGGWCPGQPLSFRHQPGPAR